MNRPCASTTAWTGPRAAAKTCPSSKISSDRRHSFSSEIPSTIGLPSNSRRPSLHLTCVTYKSSRLNSKPSPSPRAFAKASLPLHSNLNRSALSGTSSQAHSRAVNISFMASRSCSPPPFLSLSGAQTSTPTIVKGSAATTTCLPSWLTLKLKFGLSSGAVVNKNGFLPLVRPMSKFSSPRHTAHTLRAHSLDTRAL